MAMWVQWRQPHTLVRNEQHSPSSEQTQPHTSPLLGAAQLMRGGPKTSHSGTYYQLDYHLQTSLPESDNAHHRGSWAQGPGQEWVVLLSRPPSSDPAGLAIMSFVILPTHGLDSGPSCPLWPHQSVGRPNSAHPRVSPQAQSPPGFSQPEGSR